MAKRQNQQRRRQRLEMRVELHLSALSAAWQTAEAIRALDRLHDDELAWLESFLFKARKQLGQHPAAD